MIKVDHFYHQYKHRQLGKIATDSYRSLDGQLPVSYRTSNGRLLDTSTQYASNGRFYKKQFFQTILILFTLQHTHTLYSNLSY